MLVVTPWGRGCSPPCNRGKPEPAPSPEPQAPYGNAPNRHAQAAKPYSSGNAPNRYPSQSRRDTSSGYGTTAGSTSKTWVSRSAP